MKMRGAGVDCLKAPSVVGVAGQTHLQLVESLVVEVEAAQSAVKLYRDEVVATPGVSCGLNAAYRAAFKLHEEAVLIIHIYGLPLRVGSELYGAQQVCAAFLHRPLGDVGLHHAGYRLDVTRQILGDVDHV